jgi:hypothetical protein
MCQRYLYPIMDQDNLTVLTGAYVTRLTIDGDVVTGVEVEWGGVVRTIMASSESRAVGRRHPDPQAADALRHRRPVRGGGNRALDQHERARSAAAGDPAYRRRLRI